MPLTATPTPGATLLNPQDHTLILIDFQSQMAFATHSIDAVSLRNNAGLVAAAAAGFGVDTILTTVAEKSFSGPMFTEVTEPFREQALLDRTSMNTWKTPLSSSASTPSASRASCSRPVDERVHRGPGPVRARPGLRGVRDRRRVR